MPLTGPAGIFPTVRSPPASSIEDLRLRLQRLKDLAGDRFAGLDITVAYADPSVHDVTSDVERHRHTIGALRRARRHLDGRARPGRSASAHAGVPAELCPRPTCRDQVLVNGPNP